MENKELKLIDRVREIAKDYITCDYIISEREIEDDFGEDYNVVEIQLDTTDEEFIRIRRFVNYQLNKMIEIGDKVIITKR